MCVVSMVMDHYNDEWSKRIPAPYIYPLVHPIPAVSPAEIEEFRRLLERAREYDRKHNQPDCEMDEKKRNLLKIAKELGIEIRFE